MYVIIDRAPVPDLIVAPFVSSTTYTTYWCVLVSHRPQYILVPSSYRPSLCSTYFVSSQLQESLEQLQGCTNRRVVTNIILLCHVTTRLKPGNRIQSIGYVCSSVTGLCEAARLYRYWRWLHRAMMIFLECLSTSSYMRPDHRAPGSSGSPVG